MLGQPPRREAVDLKHERAAGGVCGQLGMEAAVRAGGGLGGGKLPVTIEQPHPDAAARGVVPKHRNRLVPLEHGVVAEGRVQRQPRGRPGDDNQADDHPERLKHDGIFVREK